jgi:hypothetical protein
MGTNNISLEVTKLWVSHESEIGYIEKYYSHMIKEPRLKILLDEHSRTSYFSPNTFEIHISAQNLLDILNENPNYAYASFYTIVLHEVGHAIYTPIRFADYWSDYLNILEDNRLEYQISLWNKVVKFNLLKHIIQDAKLNHMATRLVNSKDIKGVALGLLRTVDNSKFVSQFDTQEQKAILEEIFKLNYDYMFREENAKDFIDYDNGRIQKYISPSHKLEKLLIELLELKETQKQQPKQTKGKETDKSGDNPNIEKAQQEVEKNKKEVEDELEETKNENNKIRDSLNNGIGRLYNPEVNNESYRKHEIKAFEVFRQSGIKGSGFMNRNSGNAKELSLKRYMRREYTKEKVFSKNITNITRGGETSSVLFYLDISSSMRDQSRINIAIDYLRSFYDAMNKHLNIRMFAFGENTYEITRNELSRWFIHHKLEGSTNPSLLPIKNGEHVILITDGAFSCEIPEQYKLSANFVLLDADENLIKTFQELGIRNLTSVDSKNLDVGLDNATQFIRKILSKGI